MFIFAAILVVCFVLLFLRSRFFAPTEVVSFAQRFHETSSAQISADAKAALRSIIVRENPEEALSSSYFKRLCLEQDVSATHENFTNQYRDVALAYYAMPGGNMFHNKADFNGIRRLMDIFLNEGLCNSNTVFVVGGVNDGQLATDILKTCPSIKFYGFEVQAEVAQSTSKVLAQYSETAKVLNYGMSDKEKDGLTVNGSGEGAGLYVPTKSWYLQGGPVHAKVSSVKLARWVERENIKRVSYLVIDTEGYEPKVIRGMELEKVASQERFPMFQFELGGTWADERHNDDPWSIQATMKHIEDAGYEIFMIGTENWMRVYQEFFSEQYFNHLESGSGYYAAGNALCVHKRFAMPNIRAAIRAIHPVGLSCRGTIYYLK